MNDWFSVLIEIKEKQENVAIEALQRFLKREINKDDYSKIIFSHFHGTMDFRVSYNKEVVGIVRTENADKDKWKVYFEENEIK